MFSDLTNSIFNHVYIYTFVVLIVGVIGKLYLEWRKVRLPIGYRNFEPYLHNITQKTDNRKVRFRPDRVPNEVDFILIGSGISNLVLGGLLSRLGWRILILEQHDIAGGSTHTFKDKGFVFDTGLHYVGRIPLFLRILEFVTGKTNQIEWHQMGCDPVVSDTTFDVFRAGDQEYRIRAGEQDLIDTLIERFPHERDGIMRYFRFVKKYVKKDMYFVLKALKPVWLANLLDPIVNREFYRYAQRSAYDVVSDYVEDPKLRDVICALSIDGGPRSEIQSFFIHSGIVAHFFDGGYYPIGGPGVIAQKIIPTIERAGGKVMVKARVDRILIENGRATGVDVQYGYSNNKSCQIRSRYGVVSGAGLYNTYKKMLPTPYDSGMDEVLNRVTHNLTYNLLYVGLDRSAADLGIGSNNFWAWDIKNEGLSFNEYVKRFEADPWNEEPVMFIASNSAKDPEWEKERPGKCALIVGAWSTTNQYEGLDTSGVARKRDEAYDNAKERVEDRLLDYLYEIYPETQNHVVYTSLSTPETFKYYLNAAFGEVYGMDADINRWKPCPKLRPETEIPGLYLTGQDITSLGFGGALMSGFLTANVILGYGEISNVIKGRDLYEEFKNLTAR